mmetsp:Transcript_77/g.129  ORF Transcript_77/g.129 Transcript_77/m.129 type:complete len:113 (+) Transcript_77:21-359(+)
MIPEKELRKTLKIGFEHEEIKNFLLIKKEKQSKLKEDQRMLHDLDYYYSSESDSEEEEYEESNMMDKYLEYDDFQVAEARGRIIKGERPRKSYHKCYNAKHIRIRNGHTKIH